MSVPRFNVLGVGVHAVNLATATLLVERLQQRFPDLNVVGHESPSWSEDVTSLSIKGIRNAAADFIWVGLSTPKQEAFMAHFHNTTDAKGTTLGVGAAFDFLSGRVKQAPVAWQKAGCEWLWRMGQQPGRLTKRYLITVPKFGARLLAQRWGLIRYSVED